MPVLLGFSGVQPLGADLNCSESEGVRLSCRRKSPYPGVNRAVATFWTD
jgi:hypothetical protein